MLDSGVPFWWRESETEPGGTEVSLRDPRDPAAAPAAGLSLEWTEGVLESGSPFWWRESDAEPDGIEVRLSDPTRGKRDDE